MLPPCCRPGTRIAAAASELASGIGAIVEIGRARAQRPAGPPHPPTLLAADRLQIFEDERPPSGRELGCKSG
jgi:hypothetical protein